MLCVPDVIVRLVGQRSGLNDMEDSAELRRGRESRDQAQMPAFRSKADIEARSPSYFKVAPLPRDRFALQGGKQFGVMPVDILAEVRNAVIDPGRQIGDVNG